MYRILIPCVLFTAIAASMATAGENAPESPDTAVTADAVFKQMAQTYATCKTYRDSGSSVTKFLGKDPFEDYLQFQTAFRRPTDFRFQYVRKEFLMSERMIIHRDKTGTRTWWSIKGRTEVHENISSAIAGATGVSDGTAFNVPTMLFPEEAGCWSFLAGKEWNSLPEAEEKGHMCYRLTRKRKNGDFETIWVDKNTFLIMRIDERNTIDGDSEKFVTEQTVLYIPQINVEISEGELEFKAAPAVKQPPSDDDLNLGAAIKAIFGGGNN